MIALDTSVLIDALTGPRRALGEFRQLVELRARLIVPTLVVFELLRGSRSERELADFDELIPAGSIVDFTAEEAVAAARLFGEVSRPHQRQLDLGIAAHAIVREARLWTLNRWDFADVPGLTLHPG